MNCATCGEPFKPRGALKRFCSRHCQLAARSDIGRRGDHVCAGCGCAFMVVYPDKRRQYCSPTCSRRAQDRIKTARRRAERQERTRHANALPLDAADLAALAFDPSTGVFDFKKT